MIVKSLAVDQFRAFASHTVIDFDPTFTLLVGENGVGKTSALWALRVLLSRALLELTGKKAGRPLSFQRSDIAKGWPFLRAELVLALDDPEGATATCTAQKHETAFVAAPEREGQPRRRPVSTPDKYDVTLSKKRSAVEAPLAVYYSAHRSLSVERGLSKARAAAGTQAAHAEALEDRELRLGEAALLWRKEAILEETDGLPARANRAVERALPAFLGEFGRLRLEGDETPRLVVDKRDTTLDLSQLSDGERGLLAILIDLCRRLAQANPKLEHPAREGRAIVLIDELDLNMHPRWQREIVPRLTAAFPRCQFIATTHSPQIISEMQPESIVLLRQKGDRIVPERCGQAYGLDTNSILEHIMGTPPRPVRAAEAIAAVEEALERGDLEGARERVRALRTLLHGDTPVVVALEATINNLEALGDATDPQEG